MRIEQKNFKQKTGCPENSKNSEKGHLPIRIPFAELETRAEKSVKRVDVCTRCICPKTEVFFLLSSFLCYH